MRADLHTHTTASDGSLSPFALFELQKQSGVELFAITDHDTLAGYDLLASSAIDGQGTRLISGIEFSAQWNRREIHIVGLGFDSSDPALRSMIGSQAERRHDRAKRIGDKLAYLGIKGAYDAALKHAAGGIPGRPHFARHLIDTGRVSDMETAFRRYLGDGKLAACKTQWPAVSEVTALIRAAGGVAVLAHPVVYGLTRTKLLTLLGDFIDAGGQAMEVAVPGVQPDKQAAMAQIARQLKLLGSAGSDLHDPTNPWRHPSRIPAIPDGINPVWEILV